MYLISLIKDLFVINLDKTYNQGNQLLN